MNNVEQEKFSEELTEITPSQFFDMKKNRAIITVSSSRNVSGQGRTYSFITSERQRFGSDESSLSHLGYFSDRVPRPKQRWSHGSVERFLRKESTGEVSKAFVGILQQLDTHIDLGAYENIETLALWILGTYLFRMFPAYPYIHLNGMAEAGKTKTLYLVSLMAFNACMGAETTPAALVRLTHDNQSTLCLDEIEKLQSAKDEMSQSVLAILNVGYKRGASIQKMEVGRNGKDWSVKELDPYSPKILAGIRGLETTLASRCISIMLIKSENQDVVNREVDSDAPIWGEIRDMIYEGVMSGEWFVIKNIYSVLEDSEIKGRSWETWKPLLALAKYLERGCPGLFERIHKFAVDKSKEKREIMGEGSYSAKIMLGLRGYFIKVPGLQIRFISLRDLLDYLVTFDEEAFMDTRFHAIHEWMNTRWLAHELRKIGLVQGAALQKKFLGKNVKGYEIDYSALKRKMAIHGLNVDQDISNSEG